MQRDARWQMPFINTVHRVSLSFTVSRRTSCLSIRQESTRQVVFRLAPAMNFVAPILLPFFSYFLLSPLILLLVSFGTIDGNIGLWRGMWRLFINLFFLFLLEREEGCKLIYSCFGTIAWEYALGHARWHDERTSSRNDGNLLVFFG